MNSVMRKSNTDKFQSCGMGQKYTEWEKSDKKDRDEVNLFGSLNYERLSQPLPRFYSPKYT